MLKLTKIALIKFSVVLLVILGCSASTGNTNDFVNNHNQRTETLDTITRILLKQELALGSKWCTLNYSNSSHEIAVFLSIHDNENTAVDAFNAIIDQCPEFSLLELNQNGDRLIRFGYNGKSYAIDPNRIFSEVGLINSLKKYNNTYPEQVQSGYSQFASDLLNKIIPKSKNTYLIAVHNNNENNFSINTFKDNAEAEEVFVNPSNDIDDFFYVTLKQDYDYFKSKKYNVILQEVNIPDDGSLSVYCQKNNIPYINIEAQDGHLEIQKKMIIETYNLIKSKQP